MAPIRLAILETDTPLPKVDEAFGSTGYYGVFKSMFERAFANSPTPLSEILTLTRHTVVHNDISSYPPLDTIDAILITGSKHNAFDNDPWILTLVEYTRKALEQKDTKVKVIGVCFGHQIVGRALGAHVARSDNGWEISVTEMKLSEKGKELFGKETLKLQQMHRDQVFTLPVDPNTHATATLLASTSICPNQGFLIPGKVITVQGHPEFTRTIMHELLESRNSMGLFSAELFQDAMARNKIDDEDNDGLVVARGFVRFLQEDSES